MRNEIKINILKALNLFYIGLVILWEPIQKGILSFDGAGRTIVFMTLIVLVFNLIFDRAFLKKYVLISPIYIWVLWVVYSTFNLIIEGYNDELSFFMFVMHQLLTPLVVMILTTKETCRDKITVLKYLAIIFVIYAASSVTFLGADGELQDGRALGDLGNLGPLNSLYIVFFASMLFVHKKIGIAAFIILLLISFYVVIPSETRKAFTAAVIILTFFWLSQFRLTLWRMMASLVGIGIIWSGVNFALNSTDLGLRFQEGIDQSYKWNTTNVKALDFLGDRAVFYIDGWDIFKENPINGIGLKNYYNMGYGQYVLHSEYLVQLVEGGIIATILFILFNGWLVNKTFNLCLNSETRETGMLLAGAHVATLFIGITAWTYQFSFYYCIFGVIIGYIKIHNGNWKPIVSRQTAAGVS